MFHLQGMLLAFYLVCFQVETMTARMTTTVINMLFSLQRDIIIMKVFQKSYAAVYMNSLLMTMMAVKAVETSIQWSIYMTMMGTC